jgi:hypothetical protein
MIQLPRPHRGTFFGCMMLASLLGCSTARVHELPPPNYSIAGVWELNPSLSSDEDKVLAALKPKPRSGKGGMGRGDQPAPEVINDPTTDLPPIDTSPGGHGGQGLFGGGDRNERNTYRPPLDFQTNALLGGQWLKIRQSDTEVGITNAATIRSFTPGERSVVSVPSGVADQVSGWSGRNYLIQLRPQIGPEVEETYGLSKDGKQLLVRIKVGSEGRNQAIKVTRVYDRSTKDPASLRPTLQQPLPPTD